MNAGKLCNIISIVGMVLATAYCVYLWKKGILTSQKEMQLYIAGVGVMSGVVFVIIQIVQVVIPIIPGGVSCLAGVICFGAGLGFIYNYVGICIGSIIAFLISKAYGKSVLMQLFKPKLYEKYESWTNSETSFTRLFALAIFFPFAPDDFLCYLAGTTKMDLKTFSLIILLGKPGSIAIYSLGLGVIFHWIQTLAA